MKVGLFSIYDSVAAVFLTPFTARSRVEACRQILASKVSPDIVNTPLGSNPRDFVLYDLGTYDDETGSIASKFPAERVHAVSDIWADSAPSTVSP